MSTMQHQLKAHCINRGQRAKAAKYIDQLEEAILRIAKSGSDLHDQISAATELIRQNHGGKI